jgi:hypothetical protein
MRIGGSVGGRFSRPIEGITCYENRLLQNSEHKYFWTDAKFCISNNIYLIINIDSYLTNSRWYPTNQTLRDFVIWTKNELKKLGANKYNTRFTADNESDEYCDFEYYMNYVRVIHDALSRDFDLGAGNFRTQSKEWYEHLAEQYIGGHYEVFDFHMQDGLDEVTDIDIYIRWIEYIKNKYGIKRLAVTEGNNFYNVTTLHGHNLLKAQINYAEYVGCEDFCFPYVNWQKNNIEDDLNMAYNWDFHPVSPYWGDMKNLIANIKPNQRSVDGMIIKTIGHKDTDVKSGYGCLLLNETLNFLDYLDDDFVNFEYSSATRLALEQWQTDVKPIYNNSVDGRCGRMTWRYFKKEVKKKDIEAYKDLCDDLEIIMSPYNKNGDT